MTIHILAPTPPEVVEQTPESHARQRHDSGDIANCQCVAPVPKRLTWFSTSECAVCHRAIFVDGKPVRS